MMKKCPVSISTLIGISIYEGLRRPRWSHFASEIYKVDTMVYGTYSDGTWSFHVFAVFQLLQVQFRYRLKIPKQPEKDSGIHLKARYSRQAESDQSWYRYYNLITR